MKKKDISRLLQRYLTGHQEGKDAYFDADEIDELLDSFEESDDYTYYDEVLALGLRLHPGNQTCRKTHRQQMRVFRNAIRIYRTNLRGCGND